MIFPIIDFDEVGNIFISKNILQDQFSAFGNREVLNKWCGGNFYFHSDNGVGTENFYNKVPWGEIQGFSSAKYYWGNEVIKKISNKNYITGCAPIVYSEFLYPDTNVERKYKTIFLPKSDFPYKTNITKCETKRQEFVDLLKTLDDKNTIFISFPHDFEMNYIHFLPKEILDKTYTLGYNGFDTQWINRLKKVLLRSECVYAPYIMSTTTIYAEYFEISTKFYEHNLFEKGNLSEDESKKLWVKVATNLYTVVPSEKPEKWNNFMNYLKSCFENNTPDKYWWLSCFLSLDKIKEPKNLYDDLRILHDRYLSQTKVYKNIEIHPFTDSHDFYFATKDRCDRIIELSKGVSDTAINFYGEI